MPSKKSFTNQNAKHAADSFFSSVPVENTNKAHMTSEAKEDILSPFGSTSAPESNAPNRPSSKPESKTTFSISFEKKRKLDSQMNVRVNAEECAKFAKISKSKGYSKNEMINLLMSEFIKANE